MSKNVDNPSINLLNENGLAQLHEAVLNNNLARFKQLIADGADIKVVASEDTVFGNIGITKGFTVLHMAVKTGSAELNEEIVKNCKELINIGDRTEIYPVHIASMNNKLHEVKLFCTNGANLNVSDNMGQKPLHFASTYSRLEVIRTLLMYKADPNALDNRKTSPIERLVNKTTPTKDDCVRTLLEFGAEVNKVDIFQESLLDKAISNQEVKFVELLVRYGADVNKVNSLDNVPLMQALIFGGNKEIIKLLILNGANYLKKSQFGISPESYAESSNNTSILQIINLAKEAEIISEAILKQNSKISDLTGIYSIVENVEFVGKMIVKLFAKNDIPSYEELTKLVVSYNSVLPSELYSKLTLELNKEIKNTREFIEIIEGQLARLTGDEARFVPNELIKRFKDHRGIKQDEYQEKRIEFEKTGNALTTYLKSTGSTGVSVIAELKIIAKSANNPEVFELINNITNLNYYLLTKEMKQLLDNTENQYRIISKEIEKLASLEKLDEQLNDIISPFTIELLANYTKNVELSGKEFITQTDDSN